MVKQRNWQSAIIETEDSWEEANRVAYEKGWTDGLPVVPPTEARVSRMLEQTRRRPEDVVANLPPKNGTATVEKIAINAVMAGCLPSYFPVLLAAVEALAEPQFNLHGIQATTSPVGPLAIINGPIRKELGMNCGRNVMGPGNRANATVGRAIRLILLNIGGGIPEEVDKSSQGSPGKYGFCIGEDEEGNPWDPLHVERGFKKEDSAITVVGAQGTTHISTSCIIDVRDMMLLISNAMGYIGGNNFHLGSGEPLVVMTTGHAQLLAKEGFSKSSTKELLYERTGFPADEYPPCMRRERMDRVTKNGLIRPARRPEDIMIVVAGGPEPYHATFIETFGDTWAVTKPIAR